MYFGKGFEITYNDLRDIAAAIKDKDRDISKEVRRLLPLDLLDALDKVPTAHQQIMICELFRKMHQANLRSKQELLKKLSQTRTER